MSSLQSLAQDLGADERTLRRAVRVGTVRARRPSPRTLRLPEAEVEYLRSHWPLIASMRFALQTERNVRLAVLFGSVARGTERADSDVDVLASLRNPSLACVAALESKLTRAAGREVSVVLLEHALAASPQLVLAGLDHGRVLADRDARWSKIVELRSRLERRVRDRRVRDRREAAESLSLLGSVS